MIDLQKSPADVQRRPVLMISVFSSSAKKFGVSEVPPEVVNLVSHATQSRLRTLLEKVSTIAQHRTDGGKVRTLAACLTCV